MMKTNTIQIIGLLATTLLIGCGSTTGGSSSTASSNDATQGTAQCKYIAQSLEKVTQTYALSKDDYENYDTGYATYKSSKGSDDGKGSNDDGGSHNEGRNCLDCHSFASAGTVFKSLNAADNTPGAAGYRIQLNDNIVFNTARGIGNSNTNTFPSGNFTAHVIDPNGNIVNSSADMSHDASRRACNSCHTASGNNGAPGRITSAKLSAATPTGTTTASCVSFNSNVMPILEAKCKSCHGSNGNFSVTTANETHANISNLKGTPQEAGTYLIDKASNTIGHGGGSVIATSSAEYTTIKAWINEGMLNN